MATLSIKNLYKSYDQENFAVADANIEISDGEFVVLVGPSGCGKSTVLRMIAGLEDISKGEILIDGKVVNDLSPKDRDIAMVFQNYALYPHMTVAENISFGLRLRKFNKKEIVKRVNDASNILGLKELLNRKPKQLSGGQRQRVALGRAIVRNPKVFLFDEPLSNLDAKLRVQMRAEISKLHNELGTTMIYVTHDQTEAMTMGDKIVILKEGKIQQIDNPMRLYNYPCNKFVAGFIGSPAMNFIDGKLEKKDNLYFISKNEQLRIQLDDKLIKSNSKVIGKKITAGIRPEDFTLNGDHNNGNDNISIVIELAEPLGNETYIHFLLDDNKMIARVNTDETLKTGSKINLQLNKQKIHFFNENETAQINSGLI